MLNEQEVARILLKIAAIKLQPKSPFTWASGLKSPIYCDNRLLLGFPTERKAIIDTMSQASKQWGNIDIIAGVATAGIAHGVLIADRLDLPFAYIRSSPKSHGRQNLIEGHIEAKQRVVIIEDLISTGGSSIKAVEAAREAGAVVLGVLAIFSYEFEDAAKNFEQINCPFSTLSNYTALLNAVKNSGNFTPNQLNSLSEWRMDPKSWSVKNS